MPYHLLQQQGRCPGISICDRYYRLGTHLETIPGGTEKRRPKVPCNMRESWMHFGELLVLAIAACAANQCLQRL